MLRSRTTSWIIILSIALSALLAGRAQAASVRSQGGVSIRHDAWIEAEAKRLSGRNVAVTCAGTRLEWAHALSVVGLPAAQVAEFYGFSLIDQGEMHLSPYVCAGLRLGLVASTRRANELQVAWSVDVLVHESVHMGRFTSDEALTEACARDGLSLELHRLYNFAYGSAELRRLTAAATFFRQTMGTAYQHGVCTSAA
jgi:hypothetical protein